VRNSAGERGDVADAHFGSGGGRRRSGRAQGFSLRSRLVLAAAEKGHGRRDERNAELVVHEISRDFESGHL
jgi:hypothetical protein